MASLPLPSDRFRPANTAPATKQAKNTESSSPNPSASLLTAQHPSKGSVEPTASTKAADSMVDLCSHPSREGGSQQSSAVSSMRDAEAAAPSAAESTAAESTSASEAAAVADDIPIQPLNKQMADGTCVSPNIGRRSTPFSTSEPSHPSLSKGRQHTSAAATEAFCQQDMTLQNDMTLPSRRSMGDARDSAEGKQQEVAMQDNQREPSRSRAGDCNGASAGREEQPEGCEQRPYLACCVRLSEEKEPHRWACFGYFCMNMHS